ncbi:GNAT family N-acetyltransferase [Paenibacillus sp. sgz500992]|uniref:GNAT family N-acetyltransferase n=1 Tax=Paenibacillus sp. sgz500992 TaxID=3242476 RepID=UPI0036D323A1
MNIIEIKNIYIRMKGDEVLVDVEIVPLNDFLVPRTRALISGYLNSSSNRVDESFSSLEQLEKCEQILKRFLSYDLAHCYLAKYHQDYVGFIVLSWSISISKGYPVLHIDGLYSSPKYRNKGIGRRLMQYAIDLANEKKASRLQLETDDDNTPARALYTNLGFNKIPGKGVYMSFL